MRGTFANIRIKNELADGKIGGWTTYEGEILPIYDAAMNIRLLVSVVSSLLVRTMEWVLAVTGQRKVQTCLV